MQHIAKTLDITEPTPGTHVLLVERTLTDGSKVYAVDVHQDGTAIRIPCLTVNPLLALTRDDMLLVLATIQANLYLDDNGLWDPDKPTSGADLVDLCCEVVPCPTDVATPLALPEPKAEPEVREDHQGLATL